LQIPGRRLPGTVGMKILRVVGSFHLPCGCFVGVYETYKGPVLRVVDERGPFCGYPAHRAGRALQDVGVDCLVRACSPPAPSDRVVHHL
jgi:hypothetical protein